MPTYQANKTFRAGFYNSKNTDGVDDRTYDAMDMRKPYDTVFTDGIMPEADGTAGETLKVTAASGMKINLSAGHAKIGGAWFENQSTYSITLDAASSSTRYDCVILQNDDNAGVRAPNVYIKSLSKIPTSADLTRDGKIYELCVAYVKVNSGVSAITDSDITDTREDGSLCNIMSGVGATVVRTYRNTYFSEQESQTKIPIGISQYNKSKDTLNVIVEGRIFAEGTDYTITDNSSITLAIGLPVTNTRVEFEVLKNVNASGAESVVQEVGTLNTKMAAVQKIIENDYYCTGKNDCLKISEIVRNFLNGGNDYGSMKLNIHGTIIIDSAASFSVSSSGETETYWFNFNATKNTRKVIVDFTDCSQIEIPVDDGDRSYVFYGDNIHIIGANIIANNVTTDTRIAIFESDNGVVYAENCRFWISADKDSYISRTGTFVNCRGSVTNNVGVSYCFRPISSGLIRVTGGEYYAYTQDSTSYSAVAGLTSGADAVAIMNGVNAPTYSRNTYYQTHYVYQTTGLVSCTDTITTLSAKVVSGSSNIRGTLAKNKPNMM